MKNRICIAILVMGFSGLIAEILLLRELLIVFSGNELCIGIILSNWLILEAFGVFFLGRKAENSKNRLEAFTIITILFSLSLLPAIFITRILKSLLDISIGESIGLIPMFYSSFLILLPVSMLHGALFTFSCRIYAMFSDRVAASAGRVYVYETLGTIIGGIVCTYYFIPHLNTFQAASGVAMLNFMACLVLLAPYWKTGGFQKTILLALGVLIFFSAHLVFGSLAERLHHYSIKAQWKNHHVVHYQNSLYGNICILENQGQYTFFQDGVPNIIIPIPDQTFVEEFVHLPLLAHPEPIKLLILTGGAGGVINEALKHSSIKTIEYAELDPLLLDLFQKFPTPLTESELNHEKVKTKSMDGRLLLKTTQEKYDLIFIGVQEPSNLQANRFFTKEFFSLAKNRLNKGGILVLGLPGSLTYLNEELKNLNSSIFNTLETVFSHIRVIPGDGKNLFLSSDSLEISRIDRTEIIERLNQRNIRADVMIPWHIEKKLHSGWQEWFSSFIEGGSRKINSDFNPVALFYNISHWNAIHAPSLRRLFSQLEKITLGSLALMFGLFLLLYFCFPSKNKGFSWAGIPLCVITTGFAGMIFTLMLIFTFQSIYGYVFSWIGLLVASFMAGAASGAILLTTMLDRIKNCFGFFIKIELAIICFSVGWPFIFLAVHSYLESPGIFFFFKILFLAISFVAGLLMGSQFPLANKIYLRRGAGLTRTAGLIYGSDLLGGWFGGVIGAVVLLPVLGLTGTCLTMGLLKLTSFIVMITQSHQYL